MSRGKGKRTLELLEGAEKILEEIQPCSVRAVCYRLFSVGLIDDMSKTSVNAVSRMLTDAREEGEISWAWITDQSRSPEQSQLWKGPEEIIQAAVRGYRRDYWADQDYHLEVVSEKATVRGTLWPVLEQYGVALRTMHGYGSATAVHDIAELSIESDKPLVLLYCGDFDPSGKHMSDVDLPHRLEEYGGDAEVRRIALLDDDLPDLPSFSVETKRQDPRYGWFRMNVGRKCYELDAMPPPVLRQRVEDAILEYIDRPTWDHSLMIEKAEVESMKDFHKSWQALICSEPKA